VSFRLVSGPWGELESRSQRDATLPKKRVLKKKAQRREGRVLGEMIRWEKEPRVKKRGAYRGFSMSENRITLVRKKRGRKVDNRTCLGGVDDLTITRDVQL